MTEPVIVALLANGVGWLVAGALVRRWMERVDDRLDDVVDSVAETRETVARIEERTK